MTPAGTPDVDTSKHHRGGRPLRRQVAEVARFGLVGGSGVAVNIAAFDVFHQVSRVATVWSGVLATCTAIATNYVGFRYYAYRDRRSARLARESTLFVVFSVIGLIVENGILYVGSSLLGWNTLLDGNLLKALGIAAGTGLRFCSYRTWVFPRLPDCPRPAREMNSEP